MRTQPKFPAPQPQPTTPIRGRGIVPCDFNTPAMRQLAAKLKRKTKSKWAVIKPHRNSHGIMWNEQVFWWSYKGYYRRGLSTQPRRPFHHVLWEHYHKRAVPPWHEVFFIDRDYHNFSKGNLKLMTKAEVHRLTIDLGEVPQSSQIRKQDIASKRWTKQGARLTSILLDKFNRGGDLLTAKLERDLCSKTSKTPRTSKNFSPSANPK